jgi:histone deacetylase 1/2
MGAIERRHKQIVEVELSLLSHSKLPQQFWEDAFLTATYIINRLPTPILNKTSPYEIVYGHTPDYHFLKVFGCACWPYLRPYNKHKIDFRSKNCIFIGYSLDHHGYNVLILQQVKFMYPVMSFLMKTIFHIKVPITTLLSVQTHPPQ